VFTANFNSGYDMAVYWADPVNSRYPCCVYCYTLLGILGEQEWIVITALHETKNPDEFHLTLTPIAAITELDITLGDE
jgi:hypothetical protein